TWACGQRYLLAAHAHARGTPARRPVMTATTDPSLASALDALSVPGVMLGHRLIQPGDELALTPQEVPAFAGSVDKVRRPSGAARMVGRALLAQLGHPEWPVLKGSAGAPVWPAGVAGSLAHDDRVAVAAIAKLSVVAGLGIDVEPAELLPSELLELIATPRERAAIADDPYRGRLLFAAKEAVYKAVYPLDRTFLDHHDVEINFLDRKASTRNGRILELRFSIAAHIVALAYLPVLR